MRLSVFGIVGFLLVASCSGESTKEGEKISLKSMQTKLKQFEDSLQVKRGVNDQDLAVRYAEKCLAIAEAYPKDETAPKYIDKAHVIFASVGLHQRSVIIADSLVRKYPAYKNKLMVLESLASSYDLFIHPRQKDQVKKYYQMMLTEFPDMPKEQKETIERRLKYIDLTFEEYISMQN